MNRNSDIYDVVKPIMIKILENPSRNKMVCNRAFLFIFLFSSFISLTLIPVIYDKNAGYSGRTQGEMKERKPAPKAKKMLISFNFFNSPFVKQYSIAQVQFLVNNPPDFLMSVPQLRFFLFYHLD